MLVFAGQTAFSYAVPQGADTEYNIYILLKISKHTGFIFTPSITVIAT